MDDKTKLIGCYNPDEYTESDGLRTFDKCRNCSYLYNSKGCEEYRLKHGMQQCYI